MKLRYLLFSVLLVAACGDASDTPLDGERGKQTTGKADHFGGACAVSDCGVGQATADGCFCDDACLGFGDCCQGAQGAAAVCGLSECVLTVGDTNCGNGASCSPGVCTADCSLGEDCSPSACSPSQCVTDFQPACCELADHPQNTIDGSHCCADGTWAPDIGNGSDAVCDASGGVGSVCEAVEPTCCDLADFPEDTIEGAQCCGDSQWHLNDGSSSGTCDDHDGGGDICASDPCNDGTVLTCKALAQPCPSGLVREVVSGCWGECVHPFTCEAPVGEQCGFATCSAGTECCNPLAGICVVPGDFCIF